MKLRASLVPYVLNGMWGRAALLLTEQDPQRRLEIMAAALPNISPAKLAIALQIGQLLEPLHATLIEERGWTVAPAGPVENNYLTGTPDGWAMGATGLLPLECKTVTKTRSLGQLVVDYAGQLVAYSILTGSDELLFSVLYRDQTTGLKSASFHRLLIVTITDADRKVVEEICTQFSAANPDERTNDKPPVPIHLSWDELA